MSLGNGFRRAVFAVLDTRGAPWIMRGSFMRLVSSLAGAVAGELGQEIIRYAKAVQRGKKKLTSLNDSAVITGQVWLAATARREERGTGGPP